MNSKGTETVEEIADAFSKKKVSIMDVRKRIKEAVIFGAEWQKNLSGSYEGWISVKDELPPLGKEVIVYCPNCNKKITALARFNRYEEDESFYWDNHYGGSNIHIQSAVTHWKYLPTDEPPKDQVKQTSKL